MSDRGIAKNALIVGLMTFISRIGGLVREIFMASFFGTDVMKSAFDVAYRIPNLFRRLFGEGALSQALIPVYTETLEKKGKAEADKIAASVAGITVAGLVIVTGIGIILTYPIASMLAPEGDWVKILPLLRIMLPYAPLICLAALIMGILNSLKSFATSALAPAFQNICCIIALACICPFIPNEGDLRIKVVSWSILISGIVQVAVQLPELRRNSVPLKLVFSGLSNPGVSRIFKLMLPMAFAAGVMQINVALDSVLALWAADWGPSALGYADRIVYMPLAIVGTAFATVLLPTLSTFAAKDDADGFADSLERTFRDVVVVLAPASAGMIILAHPICAIIYERGAFDGMSTTHTAHALIAYSAGLISAGLHKIVVPPFYAMQDSRTPVIVGTIGVALNLAMNIFFIWILPADLKPVGIAIATAISSTIAFIALIVIFSRRKISGKSPFHFKAVISASLSSLLASVAMGAAVWLFKNAITGWCLANMSKTLAQTVVIVVGILLGVVVYFGLMKVICPSAVRELIQDFKRRKNRRKAS